MELIDLAAGQFHQEPGVFRLLIVDSIIGKFWNLINSEISGVYNGAYKYETKLRFLAKCFVFMFR